MSCLKAERMPSPRTQSLSPPQNQTARAGAQELGGPEVFKYECTLAKLVLDKHSYGKCIVIRSQTNRGQKNPLQFGYIYYACMYTVHTPLVVRDSCFALTLSRNLSKSSSSFVTTLENTESERNIKSACSQESYCD